ncbi:MAG: NAD(P)-dependent oxidoreductase [Alphaproteobacteria bacterium]
MNPDIIINTIAIVSLDLCETQPELAYMCNARVSKTIADYCQKHNKKYVYISTDHYFTKDGSKKHLEDECLNLCNEYALTKFLGEELAKNADKSLIVRTNIVGFRWWKDSPTFVEWAIDALKKQEDISLFSDFYTSSIDVKSFSTALLDLIAKETTGIINLASSEVSSKDLFIQELAKQLDLSLEHTQISSIKTLNSKVKRNESLGLDVTKAEKILGYKLPKLTEVITNLVKEYRRCR